MTWEKRSAYVFMRTKPGYAEKVWEHTKKWDKIIGSWIVTGEWDVIAWIDASDWDDIYKTISQMRDWEGVELTSSHFVYKGMKNGHWWWERPAGSWVLARDRKLNGNFEKLKEHKWISSAASLPGTWDYIMWISGDNWENVWDNVWELNKNGMQTMTKVPIRTWWNKAWKEKWWEEKQEEKQEVLK